MLPVCCRSTAGDIFVVDASTGRLKEQAKLTEPPIAPLKSSGNGFLVIGRSSVTIHIAQNKSVTAACSLTDAPIPGYAPVILERLRKGAYGTAFVTTTLGFHSVDLDKLALQTQTVPCDNVGTKTMVSVLCALLAILSSTSSKPLKPSGIHFCSASALCWT